MAHSKAATRRQEDAGSNDPPPERAPSKPFRLRNIFKTLGPGLITGAADDDPSGIGTYSQTGAQLGYGAAGPWC